MKYPTFFDAKNSYNLFGLQENFDFITNLHFQKKLPKILMLTGEKGTGKSTLINHFFYSIFDKENYDRDKLTLIKNSHFYNQFQKNIFSNIIYISGANFKSIRVDDIRNLKSRILKSAISNKDRFIVFDDVELFNQNSMNALLKIIEEPTKKNYFFLINNKTKPLLETIKSRAIELKIILSENQRLKIIKNLVDFYKLELVLDPNISKLSPGNYLKFNYTCKEFNISPLTDFTENLSFLLNLYKKDKDILFINLILFMADYYLRYLKDQNPFESNKIFEIKNFIFKNLNNFTLYNMSQNSLISAVSEKLNYE